MEDGFRDFGVGGSGGSAVDSALVVVDRREDGVLMEFLETPGCNGRVPSLKLTASLHLKMDGWNTIVSFWDGLFSGAMLVSGSVGGMFLWFFLCVTSQG